MATLAELNLPTRLFLQAYPWRRIDPVPWAPLRRPLAESRFALVTSAGFVLPGQERFSAELRGGDVSFREIPADADLSSLVETHRSQSFDHTGIRSDPNLALPLDRCRELVAAGRIGELNHRHLSFMGSITAPGRLVRDTAPEAARRLAGDGVEAALLVPV
ncbi:MAG TPA: glycine/sarcosine/betaine reductase selenoprotein B family protein [Thermoanaerobaculia bacterium]|nr:glycine/sarcosine/betaine reductase selenoprotein B family protein [Thermoanaerobaculia bacterium]